MLPAGHRPATSWVHYTTSCNTQSSAPEDGQNNCPRHVELTVIINKPLLLHLVGCLYYLYQWCTVKQISNNEIHLLIKCIKSVLWRVAKRLSYTQDARCLKVKTVDKRPSSVGSTALLRTNWTPVHKNQYLAVVVAVKFGLCPTLSDLHSRRYFLKRKAPSINN